MYLGQIVEMGEAETVALDPKHPYTQALFSAALPVAPRRTSARTSSCTGEVPSPVNPPGGCRFHPRCPFAMARCTDEPPAAHAGRGAPDRLPPVRSEGVADTSAQDRPGTACLWHAAAAHRHLAPGGGTPTRLYSPSRRGTPPLALVLLSRGDQMAPTEEAHMEQLRSAISGFLNGEPAHRRDWMRSQRGEQGRLHVA